MKRIYAIVSALAVICITQVACTSSVQTADEEEDVKAALTTFVRAFENGDLDVMEASFAENSSTFPRAIMSNDVTSPIRASEYRRVKGLDPQMRQLIAGWREGAVSPPYMSLEPKDLEMLLFTDAALVTFHLERDESLSRRTFVLAKEQDEWKIVHLRASNVVGSE